MVALLLSLAIFSAFGYLYFFDKIVRFQYENYRKEWEASGKPIGSLWSAPESSFFSGIMARNICLLSRTFFNADWMKSEPKILKTILLMRLCVFAQCLSLIALLILTYFVK